MTDTWIADDRETTLRGLDFATRRIVVAWTEREARQSRAIPWTRLTRPLSRCRVAIVSSAGLALKSDRPFDQEGERRDPWWGDPSYRVLPRETRTGEARCYHLHVDPSLAEQDLDCVLPLTRLAELAERGVIGAPADSHYSFMGYVLDAGELLAHSAPAIARSMRDEGVDVALLVPV